VISPEHEKAEVERVVETCGGYLLVEKYRL
jgi:hypothetical protein